MVAQANTQPKYIQNSKRKINVLLLPLELIDTEKLTASRFVLADVSVTPAQVCGLVFLSLFLLSFPFSVRLVRNETVKIARSLALMRPRVLDITYRAHRQRLGPWLDIFISVCG